MSNTQRTWLPSLLIAAGITMAGLAVGGGFARGRAPQNYVTVRGVSEREVKADVAIWPLRIVAAGNDLSETSELMTSHVVSVRRFLVKHRVDTSQIQLVNYSVEDHENDEYTNNSKHIKRFLIKMTVLIRSTDPDRVLEASQRISELATIGVVVSSGRGNGEYGDAGGPSFVFTRLNELKPQMIADATARAREGAEQFARDSHTTVGGIHFASQGLFEINARDGADGISEESQIAKIVRVVSSIEYRLK